MKRTTKRMNRRRENWSMLNAKHQAVLEQMAESHTRRMQAEHNEQTDVVSDIRNHISPLTNVETK